MYAAPLVYGSGMRKLSTVDDFGLSGSDLEQMYQEVILEASKDPHGRAHFAQDITSAQSEMMITAAFPERQRLQLC